MAIQMATATTLAQVAAWPTTMDALKAPKETISKTQVGKGCAITVKNLGISCCHVGSWSMTCRHEDRATRGAVTRGHVSTRFRAYQLKSPCCNQLEGSRKTRTGSDLVLQVTAHSPLKGMLVGLLGWQANMSCLNWIYGSAGVLGMQHLV